MALAVQALQARQVNRIILTRPAVEAGERLGFLPGDLMAKVDPYLRPLYDALHDLLEPEGAQRLLDRGAVEVAPLAFMRGRTLNNSFIILDEAQNTTPEQMKMFLTRIGFGSKAVVTGDVTQIDVPGGRSGLVGLEPVLSRHRRTGLRPPGQRDVVRHRIVADIVDAYERSPRDDPAHRGVSRVPGHVDVYRRRRAGRPSGQRRAVVGAWPDRCSRPRASPSDTEVSLLFVDEATIAALNERFLRRRTGPPTCWPSPSRTTATTVGASPDEGGPGPASIEPTTRPAVLLGDVVVCPAVAARNAADHGVTFDDEIALLVVHGILHLLGMDHEADAEAERMERREQQLLSASTADVPMTPAPHASSAGQSVTCATDARPRHRRWWWSSCGGLGRVGPGRDQPGPDEPGQGPGPGRRRSARGPALARLAENPQGFLNPVLLLVLVCQLIVATLVGILAAHWFGAWGVAAATVFEIVVIFVLGEAVPKNWAVHHPERAALFSAPLVSALVALLADPDAVGRPDRTGQPAHRRDRASTWAAGDRVRAAGHGRRGRGGGRDRDRGAGPHPLDHRVRRHRGARGHGAPPRHGHRRRRRTGGAVLERSLDVGFSRMPVPEQQVDDVVGIAYHQGHDPGGAGGQRRRPGRRPSAARPTSSPRPSGWRT